MDELDTVISGIATQLEATAVPSGASASKATALEALIAAAHEVAAGTHACATASGNDELAAEVDFSLTELAKGRAATVIARCTKIASLASENLAALSDYNITQAKLTALTKKIDAFEKVSSKPRQGVAKKAATNKALPRLLNQGRNILTRRMDRLMVQFRTSAPELFAEYKKARKIVGQPGTQNGKATNVVPAVTPAADLLKAA